MSFQRNRREIFHFPRILIAYKGLNGCHTIKPIIHFYLYAVIKKIHNFIKNECMISKPISVDAYIKSFPKSTEALLKQLRKAIKETAPAAEELIGYGMPAYKLNKKPLVYFAGYEKHIGFYATPSGHQKFSKELAKYKQGKGSVQFPLDEPLPIDLIIKMVKFRVNENLNKFK